MSINIPSVKMVFPGAYDPDGPERLKMPDDKNYSWKILLKAVAKTQIM